MQEIYRAGDRGADRILCGLTFAGSRPARVAVTFTKACTVRTENDWPRLRPVR